MKGVPRDSAVDSLRTQALAVLYRVIRVQGELVGDFPESDLYSFSS